MKSDDLEYLKSRIRCVQDFPHTGILFRDITPVLNDPEAYQLALNGLEDFCRHYPGAQIAGVDARGFIFAATVADRLKTGLLLVRKAGKLPPPTIRQGYNLEYGQAALEISTLTVSPGQPVILVEDLLATGGTSQAAIELLTRIGAQVCAVVFLLELSGLGGRQTLESLSLENATPLPVHSLVKI